MEHKEVIINREIEHALEMFRQAVECVPRTCLPDSANIIVSKHYVVFVTPRGDEVKLVRDDDFVTAEIRAGEYKLIVDRWDMFVLRKNGKTIQVGPRIAIGSIGSDIYSTDEFIEFVRKGFQSILGAWV